MDILTRDNLEELMTQSHGLCVSLFMPTHRGAHQADQDPIRLTNLLKEAEVRLVNQGMRSPEAGALLAPGQRLRDDPLFWSRQADGLAMFLGTDFLRLFRLPTSFEELVVVNERFHLKPLIATLGGSDRFYVLALSQSEVRLLWGSRHHSGRVELEHVPAGLEDALKYDDPERQLQFHQSGRKGRGAGRVTATFHGHGDVKDEPKERIFRYFRMIDQGLMEVLATERAPLVLAGVDYLIPLYRQATRYRYVVDQAIEGNPERLSEAELHQRALPIVEPLLRRDQETAITRYLELSATEKATNDVKQAVTAAMEGRVASVIVPANLHRWGRCGPDGVETHRNRYRGDEDLLDAAAVYTWLQGGEVHVVNDDDMPNGGDLAAVFRY